MTWEPIETAPKDGRRILAYGDFRAAYTNMQWEQLAYPQSVYFMDSDWRGDEGHEYSFTHWMPLPDPPVNLITIPAMEVE